MWTNLDGSITYDHINKFPQGSIGFIYLITFEDGSMYIGKKNLRAKRTLTPKKDHRPRPNGVFKRVRGMLREEIIMESNWKNYIGSSRMCQKKKPVSKIILDTANTKGSLTYLECMYLFKYDVLRTHDFINDNILGKFYRGRV